MHVDKKNPQLNIINFEKVKKPKGLGGGGGSDKVNKSFL